MRHRKRTVKLGRTSSHRRAMERNLVRDLFLHGRIVTTLAKAKACRPVAEKLITTAKNENLAAVHRFRTILARLADKDAARRMVSVIAPLCAERNGGYVRILKLPTTRLGDNGSTAVMELVDRPEESSEEKKGGIVSRLMGGKKGKKGDE